MARGNWDDFTDKYGFNDGESSDENDYKARDIIVRSLNRNPAMKKAGVRALAWDRGGVHNSIFVVLVKGGPKDAPKQLTKTWESGDGKMEPVPDEIDIEQVISDAYDAVEEAKYRKAKKKKVK